LKNSEIPQELYYRQDGEKNKIKSQRFIYLFIYVGEGNEGYCGNILFFRNKIFKFK